MTRRLRGAQRYGMKVSRSVGDAQSGAIISFMWTGAMAKKGRRICLTHLFGLMSQSVAPGTMKDVAGDNTDKTNFGPSGQMPATGTTYREAVSPVDLATTR